VIYLGVAVTISEAGVVFIADRIKIENVTFEQMIYDIFLDSETISHTK
jgi:hypothetical protein